MPSRSLPALPSRPVAAPRRALANRDMWLLIVSAVVLLIATFVIAIAGGTVTVHILEWIAS